MREDTELIARIRKAMVEAHTSVEEHELGNVLGLYRTACMLSEKKGPRATGWLPFARDAEDILKEYLETGVLDRARLVAPKGNK